MKQFILIICTFIGLLFIGPIYYEYLGTKYENARSNIMDNNTTRIRGNRQYIQLLKLEAERTEDPVVKQAILDQITILKAESQNNY